MGGFDLGAVVARIEADTKQFTQGMKDAQAEVSGFKQKFSGVGDTIKEVGKQSAILTAAVAAGAGFFLKSASEEAMNFEKAMISLDIIAGRFGVSGEKAQGAARDLGQELRIGTSSAAEGLQNLLKSGLSLDKATDLMKRFTNEALTGKSSSISLSQAVQNLSFAYATGNSALGNMSGLSENWSDITEKGREILLKKGKALSEISDEEAKYEGLIAITNLTQGSAARFAGTYTDKLATLGLMVTDLKVAVGQALNPVLAVMVDLFSNSGLIQNVQLVAEAFAGFVQAIATDDINVMAEALEKLGAEELIAPLGKFQGFLRDLGAWIGENQELVMAFFKGLGVALAGLLVIGTITIMIAALTNPLFLVAAAITALYMAYETNFLGMRDITNTVFTFLYMIITGFVIPIIMRFVTVIQQNWTLISHLTQSTMSIVVGLFQWAFGLILAIMGVFVGILTGDWNKAWQMIKTGAQMALDGIMNILRGGLGLITGWGGLLFDRLTEPFRRAWDTISGLMNKIKDALDFTKRHSPSVIDILNKGVRLANRAYDNLELPAPAINAGFAANFGGGLGAAATAINIDFSNAIISDEAAAERIGERIGDSIIGKLSTNIRF